MPGPLAGSRILELSMLGAGPYGVRDLADMGAEVIKVEDARLGDRSRHSFSWGVDHVMPPHTYNYMYETANRGKKSVALDLRTRPGRAAFLRLVPHCDVFVSSLRKPALSKIGASYEDLRSLNPSLVYVHVSAFGPEGPEADYPGQDLTVQARSGLLHMMRHEAGGEPVAGNVFGLADMICSLQVSYAVCLGLLHRQRTGAGQAVDVSILGATLNAGQMLAEAYLHTGKEPYAIRREQIRNPLRNVYACGDDRWIALGMSESDRFWERFCSALDASEFIDDPRFATLSQRERHHEELTAHLDEIFRRKPQEHWYQALSRAGCTVTRVQSYGELAADPQVLANEYITRIDHPQYGPYHTVGVTVKLHDTPGTATRPAPAIGQHTEEVLTELAGFSRDQVQALTDEGAAACSR